MCGIIGIASREPVTNRLPLSKGLLRMQHRGPDGEGEWWSGNGKVGFGHRRLAIIDLSDLGKQPMQKGDVCITFNGEIYNYKELKSELEKKGIVFSSHSDTEVLLAAYKVWGRDCISRLNGMFAFAIYDAVREEVFMARDRAGEKPFFYSIKDGTLKFSSELKGLIETGGQNGIDTKSLECYLAEGYVPGELCIINNVRKLPPASAMIFNINTAEVNIWRYWDLPEQNYTVNTSADELVFELETLLQDAVKKQLVADVPVGVLLSGGVDSSLITAMAARVQKVRTFTIKFPGHKKYDESEHAKLISGYFGTEHMELEAEEGTIDLLPELARQFDEPLIDSSMIPTYLVSRLIRNHCTVAVGGDGGDELFGGYRHYNRLLWLEHRFKAFPRVLRRPVGAFAKTILPTGFKGRNWMVAASCDFDHQLPLIAGYFNAAERKRLLNNSLFSDTYPENRWNSTTPSGDLLQRATRMDFKNYLAEDILVKVDRASMLNSLEVRAPMLDFRLIEFAFSKVPSALKATHSSRKILLKKLSSKVLPPEFDKTRKQGFSIPLSSWLAKDTWQNYFREILLDKEQTLFNHNVIESLFKGQLKNRDNGERLFGLLIFELWRREYKVTL